MTPCAHTWIPLSVSLEECSACGAQRRPADPYVHQQSGAIVRPTIPTTTIHGDPTMWPPITETESHD